MANDNQDRLSTAALLLGGGAAGYAAGRWIVDRWLEPEAAAPTHVGSTAAPAALPAATHFPAPAEPAGAAAPNAAAASQAPAQARTATPNSRPIRETPPTNASSDGPVTSPDQVEPGPVTSPAQVDAATASSGASVAATTEVGPVSSPSQVDGSTASAEPADAGGSGHGLPVRFDPVFETYRGAIPIEYLRALVSRESDFDPSAKTGHAIGLMQIVPVVLADYNKRHGTTYTSEHLLDPSINVAIGCELLRLIIRGYARRHPHIPNLQADWDNPRFVELLTFGWNAGFSEAGGVGRVARYLEHHGITDLTIDLVSRTARTAGASKHLSNAAKVRWCKGVAALYQRERRHAAASASATRNAARGRRWSREGRTILRDGVALVRIERVDLGDQRYAINPHETDVLTQQIVNLLNRRRR
ncbi:MAG: transglycosylase SLT domain-containing protein [Kofleriaceae bacterium]|nr:transglycosylase SLT domain-containing protein [Myxococcales bacterium]MCB9570901.1 transglycosylase SLT domain-containing protein [Kofleriaceae bacterium]